MAWELWSCEKAAAANMTAFSWHAFMGGGYKWIPSPLNGTLHT
jgi:hypothetical protein